MSEGFNTLDGMYSLRTTARFEYVANALFKTSLSFITVRSLLVDKDRSKRIPNPLFIPKQLSLLASSGPDSSSSNNNSSALTSAASTPLSAFTIPNGSLDSSEYSNTPVGSDAPTNNTDPVTDFNQSSSTAANGSNFKGGGITPATINNATPAEKEKFFGKLRRKASFYIPNASGSKNTSSFVSKISTYDNLAVFLTSRGPEAPYFFANVGRQFIWADYTFETKTALSCLQLKEAFVTCHDVNLLTRDSMEAVLGFNTGDMMIYSPISGKYIRKNKQLPMNKSGVTCIKWMPGSENLFVAGFLDGTVLVLDKDRDDSSTAIPIPGSEQTSGMQISKPPLSSKPTSRDTKPNPLSHWRFLSTNTTASKTSTKKSITSLAFSPDCIHLAITSAEGYLRVIDYANERVLDTFASYFGGLLCCAWSPDGKYLVTGGEDDLVTVWGFQPSRIVARCQGHSSWVTSVAFDAYNCTDRSYRIGSVSEDTRLCLWDFSASSLHKPKASARRSRFDLDKSTTNHPPLSKKQVAVLDPFMCESISSEPLHFISFRDDAIVTADRTGAVKFWNRPKVDVEVNEDEA